MPTCMYKSPAINIVLVLVLNYKTQDSCNPYCYEKLLMGQLGPRDGVTTAAQRGPNFFFVMGPKISAGAPECKINEPLSMSGFDQVTWNSLTDYDQ